MPKRAVTGQGEAGGWFGPAAIPTWQAAGLSLAVTVGHVLNGSGALVFGLLSVGVIWTLHRLHAQAPQSRTTADLIASVPGAAPARAISAIQFTAYVLIGAYVARTAAEIALIWPSLPDIEIPPWAGPALAVVIAAIAAMFVGALPVRVLAPLVTVLAAVGLLVYFYVALGVIAKTVSGTAPVEPMIEVGATAARTEWGPAALVVSLAIAFACFEIPTTASDRLRSVGRPLGLAMALVVLCATTAWVAVNIATTGDFRYDAADLAPIASQMFGDLGGFWPLLVATIAQAVAALLVLIWGATRVVQPSDEGSPMPLAVTAVSTIVLALVVSANWGDMASKLWGVGGLLLLVVYLAAAHGNSRLDDSSTAAWAFFALMGLVLAVVVFLKGVGAGWWSVGIAVVVIAAAGAAAVKRPGPTAQRPRPLR